MIKVTSEDFARLVNPYTGKPMEVYMLVGAGEPLFTCPETFSTSDVYRTTADLYGAWNTANGISGARSGMPVRCAYTGEPLSIVETQDGFCYSGGFNPHMFHTRDEFLRLATMRDGVQSYFPPEAARITTPPPKPEVTEAARRHAEAAAPSLDDEKVHMIEASAKRHGEKLVSSMVSMNTNRKKGR